MDSSFAYPRPQQQAIPRPPKPRDLNIATSSASGGAAGTGMAGGGGVRESNALRASVLDVALELGIGSSSLVTNWMFDNVLTEEVEEESSDLVPPPSLSASGGSLNRGLSTNSNDSLPPSHLRNPPGSNSASTSQPEGPAKYFPTTNSITSSVSSAALNYNPKLVPFQPPGLQISPTGGISFLDVAGPPPKASKLKKKSKFDAGYDSGVDGGYMSEGGSAFGRKKTKKAKEREMREAPPAMPFPRFGDSIDGGPAGGSVNTAITSASALTGYTTDKEEKVARKARAKEEKREKEEERKRKKSAAKAAKKAGESADGNGKAEGYETDAGYQSAAASTHSTPKKSRGIFSKLSLKSSRTDLKANSEEPPVPALPLGMSNKKDEPPASLPIASKFASNSAENDNVPSPTPAPTSTSSGPSSKSAFDPGSVARSPSAGSTTTSSEATANSSKGPLTLDPSISSVEPLPTTVATSFYTPSSVSTAPSLPQLNPATQPSNMLGDSTFSTGPLFSLPTIPTTPGPISEEPDANPLPTHNPAPVPTSPPISVSSPFSYSSPASNASSPGPPPSASSQFSHLSASTQSRDSRSSADSGFSSGAASSSHTNTSSFNSKSGYPMYPKRGYTGLGVIQAGTVTSPISPPTSPPSLGSNAPLSPSAALANMSTPLAATSSIPVPNSNTAPPASTNVAGMQPLKPPVISLPTTRSASPGPIRRASDSDSDVIPSPTGPRSATLPTPTTNPNAPPSAFAMPNPPPVSGGGLKKSLKSKLSLDNLPLLGNRNREKDKDRLGVRDQLGPTPSPISPNSPYVLVHSAGSSADNTPNSHDGAGLASQQRPPSPVAPDSTGPASRLAMPTSPFRSRSPAPASPVATTPSISSPNPLGFGRQQQQRNQTHPPHLLIPSDPIQRSASPSKLSPLPSPLTPSAAKRLSPLPTPNALAYYDIPPPSPPPNGPLPLPPTSATASSPLPNSSATGLTSPPSSALNNHFPSPAALRQRLASTTSRGAPVYSHHDQNLSPMVQAPASGAASRSTSPLPGPNLQRGRESPFPSRPVMSPVPPATNGGGPRKISPDRAHPADSEHPQRASEYRNWVQRVPQRPGQERQYYVPAGLQQPQNGSRQPPSSYQQGQHATQQPPLRTKKSVSFEDERPSEFDDRSEAQLRYGQGGEDEVVLRGQDVRYSNDYDDDEQNAYDGATFAPGPPAGQRHGPARRGRQYTGYQEPDMDADEIRGVGDDRYDDTGSAEGSAESWYSNGHDAAVAARNAKLRMLGRGRREDEADPSAADFDNYPPPVPRLRQPQRRLGDDEEDEQGFSSTNLNMSGPTSPLRRPTNTTAPVVPLAPSTRESIPSEYAFEDDGRTIGDRTSRWSGSIYSRVSVMDPDESGQTRDRFVQRVEAMLREQEGRAVPPVPKLPDQYASYSSWQPRAAPASQPGASTNSTPGRSWNKF